MADDGSYSYRFDRHGGIALLAFSGRLDLVLLKQGTAAMVADPAYEARWHRVVDFAAVADVALDDADVAALADFFRPLARLRRGTRLALVATSAASRALAERFQAIRAAEGGVEVGVFDDSNSAEHWALRGPRAP